MARRPCKSRYPSPLRNSIFPVAPARGNSVASLFRRPFLTPLRNRPYPKPHRRQRLSSLSPNHPSDRAPLPRLQSSQAVTRLSR